MGPRATLAELHPGTSPCKGDQRVSARNSPRIPNQRDAKWYHGSQFLDPGLCSLPQSGYCTGATKGAAEHDGDEEQLRVAVITETLKARLCYSAKGTAANWGICHFLAENMRADSAMERHENSRIQFIPGQTSHISQPLSSCMA